MISKDYEFQVGDNIIITPGNHGYGLAFVLDANCGLTIVGVNPYNLVLKRTDGKHINAETIDNWPSPVDGIRKYFNLIEKVEPKEPIKSRIGYLLDV